ncbi:hypothetical protein O7605_31620 [Verrucosispora sp. WMMA2121]|nr:hypothetical protein [Verrucosispora sp. WMMA2121]MCZ7423791.1 hypothetical protein [Verrucosispora sp. WMMA2121]MCZ7424067.1 hypothetical protein [Verrucosispora sp. WMMA2121]
MSDAAGDDGAGTVPTGSATAAGETGGTIGAGGTAADRAWSAGRTD